MPGRATIGVTPGTGALAETYEAGDGAIRQAMALADPLTDGAAAYVTDVSAIPNSLLRGPREMTVGDALNVNANAVQLATYKWIAKPTAAAVSANTIAWRSGIWHLATATRTMRIRTVEVAVSVSAVAQSLTCEIHRFSGTAPTGGSTVAATATDTATTARYSLDPRDPVSEAVTVYNTMTAPTGIALGMTGFVCASSSAALHGGGLKVYDWQEGGYSKALTIRAGVLEGILVGFISSAAPTITPTIEITFTEE